MLALAKANNEHRIAAGAAVTHCAGCGTSRLCRRWKGLWLCVDGPSKCYRNRKTVKALKDRKENGR